MEIETIGDGPGVTIEQQIRWGDMDARGHINNIIFFQYAESARVAYFAALEVERIAHNPNEGTILGRADMNFRKQMHFPGKILVTANATKISRRSMIMTYTLRDAASDEVVADGESVMVWIDYSTGKAVPIPDPMVETVARLEQTDVANLKGEVSSE